MLGLLCIDSERSVSAFEYWYIYRWDWEQSVRDAERRNANA